MSFDVLLLFRLKIVVGLFETDPRDYKIAVYKTNSYHISKGHKFLFTDFHHYIQCNFILFADADGLVLLRILNDKNSMEIKFYGGDEFIYFMAVVKTFRREYFETLPDVSVMTERKQLITLIQLLKLLIRFDISRTLPMAIWVNWLAFDQ